MSMYISTKLIGMIAFIMIFTYTAEYVIFTGSATGDYNPEADINIYAIKTIPSGRTDVIFNVWMNYQYSRNVAYIQSGPARTAGGNLVGVTLTPFTTQDSYVLGYMDETWRYDGHVFEKYINGMSWYDALPLKGSGAYGIMINTITRELIDVEFRNYLTDLGLAPDVTGNVTPVGRGFLETAQYFLGKIPEAIGQAFNLATFQIKNSYGDNIIPGEIIVIMNMFFIPLWIVLIIELLPVLALLINALGTVLDAITPFT